MKPKGSTCRCIVDTGALKWWLYYDFVFTLTGLFEEGTNRAPDLTPVPLHNSSQRLQVPVYYRHRPQSGEIASPLRPKYLPHNYMDALGVESVYVPPLCVTVTKVSAPVWSHCSLDAGKEEAKSNLVCCLTCKTCRAHRIHRPHRNAMGYDEISSFEGLCREAIV